VTAHVRLQVVFYGNAGKQMTEVGVQYKVTVSMVRSRWI